MMNPSIVINYFLASIFLILALFLFFARRRHRCVLAAYTTGVCYSAKYYSFVLAPVFLLISASLFYFKPL